MTSSDPQKPSSRTVFEMHRLLHLRPRRQPFSEPPKKPVPKPAPPERWVVFEAGGFAHHMRDDDLFAAERTFCGKAAVDLDMRPLPHFNSFPADYLFCRMCCFLRARYLHPPLPAPRVRLDPVPNHGPAVWTPLEVLQRFREHCPKARSLASRLAVYQALCHFAEEVGGLGCTFKTSVQRIADQAGVSFRTAQKLLPTLAAAGIVDVIHPKSAGRSLGVPNLYTLLGPESGSTSAR